MWREDDLQKQIVAHTHRLQLLKEREAKQGISTPPEVLIEIDEIEEKIKVLQSQLAAIRGQEKPDNPPLATEYFAKGAQAFIAGDLWEARRYYKMTLSEDPFYPRAEEELARVEQELRLSVPSPTTHQVNWLQVGGIGGALLLLIIVGAITFFVLRYGTDDPTPTNTNATSVAASSPFPATATNTPTTTPDPTPKPTARIRFWVENSEINAGDCTTLNWNSENVKKVYLDGRGVVGNASQEVCPDVDSDYALRVVRPDDSEQLFRVSVNVLPPSNSSTSIPILPPTNPGLFSSRGHRHN